MDPYELNVKLFILNKEQISHMKLHVHVDVLLIIIYF